MGKIVKGIMSVLFSSVSTLVIGLIYQPLLARLAGLELYGEIAALLAWYGILRTVFGLGMFDAIRKYVSDQINEDNNNILIISLFMPIIVASFFYLLMVVILNLFDFFGFINEYKNLFYILGLSLIFANMWTGVRAILYSYHKEDSVVKFDIAIKITNNILILIFVILNFNIYSLAYAFLITGLIKIIFTIVLWKKIIKVDFNFKKILNPQSLLYSKKILRFGIMSVPGILSAQILYKSDILLIDYFLGSSYTGVYKVALTLAEKLWMVPKAVQSVIFHNSSELWGQNKFKELSKIFNESLKYTNLFLILFGVGLFVLAEPFIILVFGNDYALAVSSLQILIIGTFAFGLARIFLSTYSATSWLRVSQIITIVVAIINIILNFVFIPLYGIIGAAIATSFTYFLMLVLALFYYFNNDLKFLVQYNFIKMTGLTFSFFGVHYSLNFLFGGQSLIAILIMSFAGLISFIILGYLFGLFTKQEYEFFKNLIK
ncbi:Vng0050c [Halanaerobium saccharolyticum subsp. saccharolyticum DSM 6643]|uniref:Vng0050c n=1 Tax=Halanaerobium saccharolyticum subsp. saccharolyticum DSM 6643 TaxID=1293054 RepID=M5E3R9_9FIRM|nr:flippase [Halanaerobium saccharolyticum]CCU80947.1 Vng0050c [Halanaerobium saccharolyticum subsp. saccharolyticum DSM 6643]